MSLVDARIADIRIEFSNPVFQHVDMYMYNNINIHTPRVLISGQTLR